MKIIGIVVLVMALAVISPLAVIAEEGATSADPVTGAVKTVGKAVKGTVETAVSPIEAMSKGEGDKMITEPVKKGGETVVEATQDTGKTVTGQPVE